MDIVKSYFNDDPAPGRPIGMVKWTTTCLLFAVFTRGGIINLILFSTLIFN